MLFSFAKLSHSLIDARGRKSGHHADSRRRDGVRRRELRHARIQGYKAKHKASAAADDRYVLVVQRRGFHARTGR